MKTGLMAVALAGMLGSGAVMANDGNALLNDCQQAIRALDNVRRASDSDMDSGMCFGMMEGVRAMMMYLKDSMSDDYKACFPKGGISNAQAVRIVVKHLSDNPAILHLDGPQLTVIALHEAFPCK